MAEAQSFRNHGRLDPPLHFFVSPVLLLNVLIAIGWAVHSGSHEVLLHIWLVVVSAALVVLSVVTRASALRAQDRVIRLEESLRYQRLLNPEDLAAAQALHLRQIIALRFASDSELPALLRRTLAEGMTPKAIKQAVAVWRPDLHRV